MFLFSYEEGEIGGIELIEARRTLVSYAFPARVAEIHVRVGDWVKKGQKLVTLQSEEVGTAKSEFYKARADHDLAQVNFEREKRLFNRGVGAQKNLQAAEAELKVAEVNLNAAEKSHRPLAVVYIGGFFFAILLRLFIVPVLYEVLAGIGRNKRP